MARLINLGGVQPVDEGEALVVNHLATNLPNTYLLYPNLEITEPGRQPYEYDLIVVAPHAVYVVEVKRWLQRISGGDYNWQLASGTIKSNPLRLANQKARVLKSRLTHFSLGLKTVWVEACVVIADPHTVLNLTGAAAERVFRYPDVGTFLQDPTQISSAGRFVQGNGIAGQIGQIRDAIEQEGRVRTSVPQQIGHYEILETLARTDLTDDYVVRNVHLPVTSPMRLRVFTFSPYLPEVQRIEQRTRIQRDANAIQAIGPHPNLVGIRDFNIDDANHYLEVTDWSETGTLRDRLDREPPLTSDEKINIIVGIARGLSAAHNKGVIHRDLRPENVLLNSDGVPRLMNFEHARLPLPGNGTVWRAPAPDADRRYLPPELDRVDYTVTPAADLYALGAIMYELLSGTVPFDSPEAFQRAGGHAPPLTNLVPNLDPRLGELAAQLYQLDSAGRQAIHAEDVVTALTVPPQIASSLPPTPEPVTSGPMFYNVGDEIVGKFKVQAHLGRGGFGDVYKVFHYVTSQVYAMKVINGQYSLDRLQEEYQTLAGLDHPNIAKVRWADMIRPDQFFLAMEFIDGETLDHFTRPDNLLPPAEAVRLIIQLLSALEYLHEPNRERVAELQGKKEDGEITSEEYEELQQARRRFLHRDIKPSNLMLTRTNTLKLIDFNIAARLDAQLRFTQIGTPAYMAPDIRTLGWDESADLFAVGVVLYELITGHHPYPNGLPNAAADPEDPNRYRSDLSEDFAWLLYKAVQPYRADHFQTAHEMRDALLQIEDRLLKVAAPVELFLEGESKESSSTNLPLFTLEPWEINKSNYNPYVTRLLTLYSQAKRNNSGTRGLDEIARATYVSTWLDDRLKPDILDGKYRLVIITGNAGDGKTAFIQQLEHDAEKRTEVKPLSQEGRQNGSRFTLAGLSFQTNYDGSQDEGDKSNDVVLDEFFAPFRGESPFAETSTEARLIAINEGRLLDFLADHRADYPALDTAVARFLDVLDSDSNTNPVEGLLVVNLNWRAVTAGEEAIFSRQLKKLVDPRFWADCRDCVYQDRCFLKANADRIGNPNSGNGIIERLRKLFEVVYLRRRLHITMRDTRSALSYFLLRDHSCDDVAQLLDSEIAPADYLPYFYYNAVAAPDEPAVLLEQRTVKAGEQLESTDRMIRLLDQIDPALTANPDDDWRLSFARQDSAESSALLGASTESYDRKLLEQVRESLASDSLDPLARQDPALLARWLRFHAMLRRKSYFERIDGGWEQMLPYHYLNDFLKLTGSLDRAENQEKLKSNIGFAISTAEGMRQEDYAHGNVILRAGSNPKARIGSFRRFPIDDFQLRVPRLGMLTPYIEYSPDRIFFEHVREPVRLTISLDLFELLQQIATGAVPTPADVQGYFLNLTIFKNALAHLPYREVLLTENSQQFYRVWADDQNVIHMSELLEGQT